MTDRDEGDAALSDQAANLYGPLTEAKLEEERKKTRFDPLHPRRPLRILPIGREEEDTADFKAFRRYALDNDLMIKFVDFNPKSPSSKSWHRFERYRVAETLRGVIELSITASGAREREEQRRLALKDIAHDALRGYILFPQHEHNSTSHFVAAAALAEMNHTRNIHQLYSEAELDRERQRAEAAEEL